ncbi:hypothetical protein PFISCL1PPCAC_11762, partial [Pristionchus fissidentatus]
RSSSHFPYSFHLSPPCSHPIWYNTKCIIIIIIILCRMSRPVNASRFEGKVAIVTAATQGIGFAIAERLAKEGAAVVISSRKEKNVQDAVASLRSTGSKRVEGVVCHVGKEEDRKNLVQFTLAKFGRIDVLVNNHGINPVFVDIMDIDEKMWDRLFETNVKNGWQLSQLVAPHMKVVGGGSIIFNSSYTAYKNPTSGIAAYAVTKTALLGLVKALAASLAKDKIRVNGIAPGVIKTKMSSPLWDNGEKTGEDNTVLNSEILLGRLGVPEDLGGAVAFLASEDASYITGETIVVAGGINARL